MLALENVKSQMRKGILEYCILLIINRRAAYSNDIITALKDSKLIVVEGTLYPLLTRLRKEELLEYIWVESNQGPPRKYYKLTKKGEAFLSGMHEVWFEIKRAVNGLQDIEENELNDTKEELEPTTVLKSEEAIHQDDSEEEAPIYE